MADGVDLGEANDDVVSAIIAVLPASDAMRAARCSKTWCELTERSFEARCRAKGWRLPRRPRGEDSTTKYPWRRLYRTNACARCVDGPGEFRVSRDAGRCDVRVFMVCTRCAGDANVVARLARWGLLIDFQSVTGAFLPQVKLKRGSKRERKSGEPIDRGIRGFV